MTFAIITPALIAGAFAERMKFSAHAVVHRPVGDLRLRADRALGLGTGRLPRRRQLRRRDQGARLRRRHGRAHQLRHRRPGVRARARQAHATPAPAAQPGADLHRRLRCCGSAGSASTPARRSTAGMQAGMAMAVTQIATAAAALRLDVRRVDRIAASRPCSASARARSRASSRSRRPPASSARSARSSIGIAAGVVCYWGVDRPQAHARL